MKSEITKLTLYNIVVCFAVYWFSNLVLWYPWSINEALGQILMLTLNPLFWGLASYSCIVRFPNPGVINGVLLNSLIFVIEAIASDLVFFAAIRNALGKLMHVTTLYVWGFFVFAPFLIYFLFRKLIIKNKMLLVVSDFWKPLIIGLISFTIITIISVFNIELN